MLCYVQFYSLELRFNMFLIFGAMIFPTTSWRRSVIFAKKYLFHEKTGLTELKTKINGHLSPAFKERFNENLLLDFIYLSNLSKSMQQSPSWTITVAQIVKKFHAVYGNPRFSRVEYKLLSVPVLNQMSLVPNLSPCLL